MASVDYDPIKAHEYYERTKRLKGRRPVTKFNQKQKEQYAYVKEQLRQQQKERNEKAKEQINAQKKQRLKLSKRLKKHKKKR